MNLKSIYFHGREIKNIYFHDRFERREHKKTFVFTTVVLEDKIKIFHFHQGLSILR